MRERPHPLATNSVSREGQGTKARVGREKALIEIGCQIPVTRIGLCIKMGNLFSGKFFQIRATGY